MKLSMKKVDRTLWLEAKRLAEWEGMLFHRWLENAMAEYASPTTTFAKAVRNTNEPVIHGKRQPYNVQFTCSDDIHAASKGAALRGGYALGAWIEKAIAQQVKDRIGTHEYKQL